jgi:phosphatidylglycerophosphate synthase
VTASARSAAKSVDAWWTVLVIDPVAIRLLPALSRFSFVTPLRITLVAGALSGLSVAAFATGHLIAGALLFELSFFVDCLDGKLARLRGETSALGAFLDQFLDVILRPAAYVALAWWLFPGTWVVVAVLAAILVESWLRLAAAKISVTEMLPAPARVGGARAALARRRLALLPSSVELETLCLFVAPLTGSSDLIHATLVIAVVGYSLIAALHLRRIARQLVPSRAEGGSDR